MIQRKWQQIAFSCLLRLDWKLPNNWLTERYGHPYRIITACRKETKHWSQIKAVDTEAYQKMQNFLVELENIDHLQSWNVLDTSDIMCMLLSKLPGSTREKGLQLS